MSLLPRLIQMESGKNKENGKKERVEEEQCIIITFIPRRGKKMKTICCTKSFPFPFPFLSFSSLSAPFLISSSSTLLPETVLLYFPSLPLPRPLKLNPIHSLPLSTLVYLILSTTLERIIRSIILQYLFLQYLFLQYFFTSNISSSQIEPYTHFVFPSSSLFHHE